MTYPTVDAGESGISGSTAPTFAARAGGRVRTGLLLAGLLSLTAVFWIAIFRLVA